jgi:hypothetical protein
MIQKDRAVGVLRLNVRSALSSTFVSGSTIWLFVDRAAEQ